jgi:streptogrisin D
MIQTSRSRRSRAVLVLSALSAIAAVGASVNAAEAAGPSGSTPANPHSAAVAIALATQLGTHSAGAYVDAAGHSVVTVTDSASAAKVRAIGATPKLVKYNAAALNGVTKSLDASARIPGTAWAIDPASDQVIVSIDQTVTGAKLAKVTAAVTKAGDAARLQRVAGTFSKRLAGGDAIYGPSITTPRAYYTCSLGFNVRSGSTYYFLTAGHCVTDASTWYSNSSFSTKVGDVVGSSYPGNDYALVRYTDGSVPPSTVDLYNDTSQNITSAGDPYIGESVKRSGVTTGLHGGTVQATNVTVTYPDGTVTGMIQTNVCGDHGDSGGSLFDGSTALGLTSGGSGNCTTGGTTFYQPVTKALSAYGVSVYSRGGVTVRNPGSRIATVGKATSLQIAASASTTGQSLTYRATGLPAGLAINASTGMISGTPTTAATYTVTVTASDSIDTAGSATFKWAVNGAESTLMAGQSMAPGQNLWSPSHQYSAVFQTDGNLVVYGPTPGAVAWRSNTGGQGGTNIYMQTDGNLVIYAGFPNAVWSTSTWSSGSANRLVMQDDGKLVIYTSGDVPVWSSGTRTGNTQDTLASGQSLWANQNLLSASGQYSAVLQGDGNFVVYGPTPGAVRWYSSTGGAGDASLVIQTDGNMVEYAGYSVAWYTGTSGSGNGNRLVMRDDGNLILYSSSNVALWSNGHLGAP